MEIQRKVTTALELLQILQTIPTEVLADMSLNIMINEDSSDFNPVDVLIVDDVEDHNRVQLIELSFVNEN